MRFLLLTLLVATALPSPATVQPLHYYRMGEADTVSGVTHDSVGSANLQLAPRALYVTPAGSSATTLLGSTKCLRFPSLAGAFANYPGPFTELTENVGIEAWVNPNGSTSGCIVYNGTVGTDGWGIVVSGGKFQGQLGATLFGSGSLTPGVWSHVALVVFPGYAALYVNGVGSGGIKIPASPGTGSFSIGASPVAQNFFYGEIDEVRMFTFQQGAFNPLSDLLVNAPNASLTGSGNFGAFKVGQESPAQHFTIINEGLSELHVSSLAIEGEDASDFAVSGIQIPATITVARRMISPNISFAPTAPGAKTATLKIVTDDADQAVQTLSLTGTGIATPDIAVSNDAGEDLAASSREFQTFPALQTPDGTVSRTFTIGNKGTADLTGLAVAMEGTNAGEFHLLYPGLADLPPGESTAFTVEFSSRASGVRRAVLVIRSDDFDEGRFAIPLTAVGSGPKMLVRDEYAGPLASGEIFSWGSIDPLSQVPAGLGGIRTISTNAYDSLALKPDGTVVAWGSDEYGQSTVPAGLSGVVAVAAGRTHSLALKSDGTVVAWGSDVAGETEVPAGLGGVVAVAAGDGISMALRSDGNVATWGDPIAGPVPAGLGGVVAIAAGGGEALALKSDGSVVSWPDGHAPDTMPVVTGISAAEDHFLAVTGTGAVVQWEGDSSTDRLEDVTLDALAESVAISAGYTHDLGLKSDGTVVADAYHDLTDAMVPTGLRGVKAVAAGYHYSYALKDSVEDFGACLVGGFIATEVIVMRNTGLLPLKISSIKFVGDANGFHADQINPTLIPPGGLIRTVVFLRPTDPGEKRATLRIASDDLDQGNFDIQLTGIAVDTLLKLWRYNHFGTIENEGTAADLADPNGNGMTNLAEYALGGDPLAGGRVNAPKYAIDSNGHPQLSFIRNSLETDITLTVQAGDSPSGPWTDLAQSTGGHPFQPVRDAVTVSSSGGGSVTVTDTLSGNGSAARSTRFMRLQLTGQ